MKRIFYMVFLITAVLTIACISKKQVNTGKSLEIAVWGTYKEIAIIKESIANFNKQYPDITVKITHAPAGQGYIDRILTRAASGTLPDILFCEVNFIGKFINNDMLLDLTQFINKDKDISIKDYFPKNIKRFMKNGKVYALPRDVAPFACIFYNKNLFDKEGLKYPSDNWTLNDLVETAKKLTKRKNNIFTQYGFYTWVWQNFLYEFGGKIVDDVEHPTKCVINSPAAVKGIRFYIDLMYKHRVMPSPASMETGANELFMTGKLAMYGSGIWETPQFRDIKNFKWDIVMFPKGPAGIRAFATGGSGYAISKKTKNPELAYKLLKYIAGEYGQIKLAQTGLAQPSLKRLAYGKYWAGDKTNPPVNKGMLNQAVNYIIYNPYLPDWQEIESKSINSTMDLIIRNQLDVKKGLDKIAKEFNKMLGAR